MQTFTIYTDGGARGNPGPAGAGAVVLDGTGKEIARVSKFLGRQTNNWAEYEAIYLGLEALKKKVGAAKLKHARVEVKMDSELAARQLSGVYQVKEPTLFPQFMKIHNMRVKDIPHVLFTHIPREKNRVADQLANDAMDAGEK